MKIGVFDSGIGGEAVATELRRLLPQAIVLSANDHEHVPYGGRTKKEIIALTAHAIQPLLQADCDVIVLACNTATTNAITELRALYQQQKFVGIEPMVKPAAQLTKTGTFAVLATPATLASKRYKKLKHDWASSLTIIEPDCRSWASLIERQKSAEIDLEPLIANLKKQNVDVIVLACTHYHWLKERIESIAGPDITVLEPTQAIRNQIVEITGSIIGEQPQ